MPMKPVTLRKIPPHIERLIRQKARKAQSSINRAVIQLLQERAGTAPKKPRPVLHHDLDHLAGTWSKEAAANFALNLEQQRTVDPELWK